MVSLSMSDNTPMDSDRDKGSSVPRQAGGSLIQTPTKPTPGENHPINTPALAAQVQQLDTWNAMMSQMLSMNSRVDRVEQRIDELESSVKGLDGKMERMENKLNTLIDRIGGSSTSTTERARPPQEPTLRQSLQA